MQRKGTIGVRRPERRAQIMSAARRVIEQKGLEGVSLRLIARELGCTTGVLTHHFMSKEDLLRSALDAVFPPFTDWLANAQSGPTRLEGIRQLMLYCLPTNEPKQATIRLWLWIVLRAAVDPSLAADYRQRYGAFRSGFKKLLEEGQQQGEFRNDFDPAVETDLFFAFVDGLAIHALAEPGRFPSDRLETLINHQLDRLTGPKAESRRRPQNRPLTRRDSRSSAVHSQR